MRELEGATLDTYMIKATPPLVTAAKEAGRDYAAAVEGKGGDHSFGPPYIHVWIGMANALKEMEEAKKLLPAYNVLCKHVEELEKLELDEACELVRACKAKAINNPGKKKDKEEMSRWHFRVEHSVTVPGDDKQFLSVDKAVRDLLRAMKIERKPGPPPPGPVEKSISKVLSKRG